MVCSPILVPSFCGHLCVPLVSEQLLGAVPLAFRERPSHRASLCECSCCCVPWGWAAIPEPFPGIPLLPPAQARCSHPPANAQSELVPSSQGLVAGGHPCAVFGRVSSCASLLLVGFCRHSLAQCLSSPLRAALPSPSLPSMAKQECDEPGESSHREQSIC